MTRERRDGRETATRSDEAVWTALSMRGQLTDTGSWRWSVDTLARPRDRVNTLAATL